MITSYVDSHAHARRIRLVLLLCSFLSSLMAGDRREGDAGRRDRYSISPTLVREPSPSKPAAAAMPVADDEHDVKEKKSHKEAAPHEHEIKAHEEACTFGPSLYPPQGSLMAGQGLPAIAISRAPCYKCWREWDFENHIAYGAWVRDESQLQKKQAPTAPSNNSPPYLFMSNGARAISVAAGNQLEVNYWATPKLARAAACLEHNSRQHCRTTITGHIPHVEYLCAVNPSCTKVLTVPRTLAYIVLHKIVYHKDDSVTTTRHVYNHPWYREQVPMYFVNDEKCITLSLGSNAAMWINFATERSNLCEPFFDEIQTVELCYDGFGLKARLQTATGPEGLPGRKTPSALRPAPEAPRPKPEVPHVKPATPQPKPEVPQPEPEASPPELETPYAMPRLEIPAQLAEHAVILLESVSQLPE